MGKKIICFIFCFSLVMNSFGQDMYTEKIKWEEHVESITCSDTCDIISKEQQRYHFKLHFHKKLLITGNQSFYCVFVPFGSGIPWWSISVYKKNENKWNLAARGTVVRPVALTARISSNNDKILFFTDNSYASKTAVEVNDEVEEIGELSLTDLQH